MSMSNALICGFSKSFIPDKDPSKALQSWYIGISFSPPCISRNFKPQYAVIVPPKKVPYFWRLEAP